ncbi:MAG: hypothetical protein PSX80_04880, partial [bacterium]|nr:hypothetical protein [bacterium]
GFVWIENGLGNITPTLYILPWTLLSAVCVLAPSAYLLYIRKFNLFHPLVLEAWIYVFPAFIVGSFFLAFGWVDPYYLSLIDDPTYNLPLSLVYISVGFLGLTAGFFIPVGQYVSDLIAPRLPAWHWRPGQVWLPGTLLLCIGISFNVLAFLQGLVGYQKSVKVEPFDGLLSFLVAVLGVGTLLLWLGVFSTKRRGPVFYGIIVVLLILVPVNAAVAGSRGSLLSSLIQIAYCFVAAGRKLNLRVAFAFGVIGLLALVLGMAYGTSFRNIKGSEARTSSGDYFGQVVATIDYFSTEDPNIVIQQTAEALTGRIENLSSVAVVVANYERLAPYEESYGLENNILNDFYTSFIPRFIWNEKPRTSDPRALGDLYFNYGENSFAISPFADLLRNFGPIGVPLGMFVLGIYLRSVYAALIDTPHPEMWKKVAYFVLLPAVSYEGFYAAIFPTTLRLVLVLAITLWLTNLIATRFLPRQHRTVQHV